MFHIFKFLFPTVATILIFSGCFKPHQRKRVFFVQPNEPFVWLLWKIAKHQKFFSLLQKFFAINFIRTWAFNEHHFSTKFHSTSNKKNYLPFFRSFSTWRIQVSYSGYDLNKKLSKSIMIISSFYAAESATDTTPETLFYDANMKIFIFDWCVFCDDLLFLMIHFDNCLIYIKKYLILIFI